MAKREDKIVFNVRKFGVNEEVQSFLANVNIEGLAGYTVGLPSTGNVRTDLIAMLRRLADVIESGADLPGHYANGERRIGGHEA